MSSLAREDVAPDEPKLHADFIAFLTDASLRRHPTGTIRRFNQGRHAGCVEAEFTVLGTTAPEHRVGLFAKAHTYPAWIRFGSASSQSDRERDVRGMSIKLSGVEGTNLTPGSTTQDFVLNSHPVMVAANTRDFLELLKALEAGGLSSALYFVTHPKSARIGFEARRNPTCHLDIPYWSTTPYLFGKDRAVKYIAMPSSATKSALPARLTDDYLHDALKAHLLKTEATFDFLIQLQTDERTMPIEDATVEWKERDSPYIPVARIRIPTQDIDGANRPQRCEEVAFSPWNCLAEHQPLGSLNRARKEIYQAMADLRHQRRTSATGGT
jgi:hypothetical protein